MAMPLHATMRHMIALNHVLTGAAIGMAVRQPLLVVPLAFLSHFILDSLPHFTYGEPGTRRFWITWSIDAAACTAALALLCMLKPELALVIIIGGVIAELPDVSLLLHFRDKGVPDHWFFAFHKWIQWSETNTGAIAELLYLTAIVCANSMLLA